MLVTDFSVTSVKNTRLIMSVIGVLQVDPERIVVVANHRDAPLAGGMDKARIEDFLRHPVAAEIPHDAQAIGGSVSSGVPVVIGGHSSPATAASVSYTHLNHTRPRTNYRREDIEQILGRGVLIDLPYDPRVDPSLDSGMPIVLAQPRSELARRLTSLAQLIAAPASVDVGTCLLYTSRCV